MDVESSEEENFGASPDISTATKEATAHLLSAKSKKLYEKAYTSFINWCDTKSIGKNYTEKVLLLYFAELSETYKVSSLWSYYSKLKSTLLIHHNVDIGKFLGLTALLKQKSDFYKPKDLKILNREQVLHFIAEAPDDLYLMTKVAVIMGIAGAMRCQELLFLSVEDIEDKGAALIVTVKDTKTKTDRSFHILNPKDTSLNFIELYRKYASLRPAHTNHRRFFIFYKNGKCSTQPVGKNTLGKISTTIAAYLKLPDPKLYTGHCLRRSSASLLEDSGAYITTVKRRGGCKSRNVAGGL